MHVDIRTELIMRSHKSTPPMFPLYSVTSAGLGAVTWRFSFNRHLVQLSWGAIPQTLEAIRSALLPRHFVTATSDGFLTTISDASLPCFCSSVSSDIVDSDSIFHNGPSSLQHIQQYDRGEIPVKVKVCSSWKR